MRQSEILLELRQQIKIYRSINNYQMQGPITVKEVLSLSFSPQLTINMGELVKVGDLYLQFYAARISYHDIKRTLKGEKMATCPFSMDQIKQHLKQQAIFYVNQRLRINPDFTHNHKLLFGLLSIDFGPLEHKAFEEYFLQKIELKAFSLSQFSIFPESNDVSGYLHQSQDKSSNLNNFWSNLSPIRPKQNLRYADSSSQTQQLFFEMDTCKKDWGVESYLQSIVSCRAQINYFTQFMKFPFVTYQKVNWNNKCYVTSRISLPRDNTLNGLSNSPLFGYGCSSNYKSSCEQAAYQILKQIYFMRPQLYQEFIAMKSKKKVP